jgi:hypothetical protein
MERHSAEREAGSKHELGTNQINRIILFFLELHESC